MIHKISSSSLFARSFFFSKMQYNFSLWSNFVSEKVENPKTLYKVLHSTEASQSIMPKHKLQKFTKNGCVSVENGEQTQTFISQKIMEKLNKKLKLGFSISQDSHIQFSQKIQTIDDFAGLSSAILSSGYAFSRKQESKDNKTSLKISISELKQRDYIIELAKSRIRAKEWANTRGDQANTQFFLKEAERVYEIGKKNHGAQKVTITTIKGDDLLKEGFRLMHAVGRASVNQPIFINLTYKGNPQSDQFHSIVGKGVCFDTGGLNLKPTSGIKEMHMDKHGACSVLSAFEAVVKLGLKVNVTASMGFVENSVNENAYRPLDIIKSRKGLTVQIGNTDAEGRLVLADCMNWTQEKYKCVDLIELSTLTGAIIMSLGRKHAGLFSNNDQFSKQLQQTGRQVNELLWRMPLDEYHHELIKPKTADITNSPGKYDASSCQAGAFLERFVEPNVKWAHLDIAGTGDIDSDATGYGARLLVNHLKHNSKK